MQNKDRVVELLQEAIDTRLERNHSYMNQSGNEAYKQHGVVLNALFPNGIDLKNSNDMSRYGIFDMIVGKILRYANNFERGGHDDSLRDISVYCNMLRELDELIENGDVK